ncbi:phospholipid carrier-dependent glycosyltransferase [Chryseobacterium ginsenosidimutans]|uniref:phospholipid carrier-dependent glycosyltransferase n=1 Tax=Chryseobacterium ginsenosidimutans TaxID=687846 RepID=UPI003CD076A4
MATPPNPNLCFSVKMSGFIFLYLRCWFFIKYKHRAGNHSLSYIYFKQIINITFLPLALFLKQFYDHFNTYEI